MTALNWIIIGCVIIVVGLNLVFVGIYTTTPKGTGLTGKIIGIGISPDDIMFPKLWTEDFTPPADEDLVYQPWRADKWKCQA